jgi:hypothetical protein
MGPPVEIHLQPDGIWILHTAGITEGVFRQVGQYWFVGAVDRDTYPYEVLITVVRRDNEPKRMGKVSGVIPDYDRG